MGVERDGGSWPGVWSELDDRSVNPFSDEGCHQGHWVFDFRIHGGAEMATGRFRNDFESGDLEHLPDQGDGEAPPGTVGKKGLRIGVEHGVWHFITKV